MVWKSAMSLDETNGHVKEGTRVGVSGAVFPLAISPNRRFLYAGLRSEPYGVTIFEIDQTNGLLIPLATGDAQPSDIRTWNPIATVIDPDESSTATYDERYAQYRELYPATAGIVHALAEH